MTSTIEKYIPPAVFAGIVRGLVTAVGMGLVVSIPIYLADGDVAQAIGAGLLAALGALGFRTGEGAIDARRDAKEYAEFMEPVDIGGRPLAHDVLKKLSPDEAQIIEAWRTGKIAIEDIENLRPVGDTA